MSAARRGGVESRRRLRPDDWLRLQVAVVLVIFTVALVLIVVRLATYG